MRILYLSRIRLNPYVTLLANGVHQADSAIRGLHRPTLSWSHIWLDPRWRILHLHWIESQYAYGPPPHPQAPQDFQRLLKQLAWIQKSGRKIVYTVHNMKDHEDRHPELNRQANQWIMTHADAIHVHHRFTARQIKERFDRERNVFVIPHGNYIGYYPDQIDRSEARKRLNIPPNRFVFLCLGQMRPYKGLDALILAYLQKSRPDAMLVLAGKIDNREYEARLKRLAGAHPHIRIFPQYVPAEEVQLFFRAADITVLPYRDATTSGAAMLAFSFGNPIIAPAIGPFPELIGRNERGLLFQPDEHDLAAVLDHAREVDAAAMSAAAFDYAKARDWTTIGRQHARVYRQLLSG